MNKASERLQAQTAHLLNNPAENRILGQVLQAAKGMYPQDLPRVVEAMLDLQARPQIPRLAQQAHAAIDRIASQAERDQAAADHLVDIVEALREPARLADRSTCGA